MAGAESIARFRAMVANASALDTQHAGTDGAIIERFRRFVVAAEPLAVGHAKGYLDWFAPRAALAGPWLLRHDLLDIVRLRHHENTYTRLLAWALEPEGAIDPGVACQRALLSCIGLPANFEQALVVRSWLNTESGIPDLVLHGPRHLVVIEAKTLSSEHEVPGGGSQTERYLSAARSALAFGSDVPGWMVFLTLDRAAPVADDAVALTWAEVAMAFACALGDPAMLSPRDLYYPFATLITQWFLHSSPSMREVCLRAGEWATAPTRELLSHLAVIQEVEAILPRPASEAT